MQEEILTFDEHNMLSKHVTSLTKDLDLFPSKNGHVSDRYKEKINTLTICASFVSEFGEPIVSIHIYQRNGLEIKVHLTKISESEVDLDFEIGFMNRKSIDLIKRKIVSLQQKVQRGAERKRRNEKLRISTKNWSGHYLYRGLVSPHSKWFKNYEEAMQLNIASPDFIQSMKDWNFHFRDY